MIAAVISRGYTFEQLDRMTIPQIHFIAAGFTFPDEPLDKTLPYEDLAIWRKRC